MLDFHERGCIYEDKPRSLMNCPCWLVFDQGQPGVVNQAATLALEGKLRQAFDHGYDKGYEIGYDDGFDAADGRPHRTA